ncbi:hypothetical protein K1T71_004620 [Dendrolimus kikuchii]|uniref:Uncharacterized protein n=1 Tax=Dendrolimus kikuchii TaxID=765133 RepID=A0ACC1D7X7_9NEOP|nr:hypothetical protein K1T71_004620 [Dendrolimus kikuchii]
MEYTVQNLEHAVSVFYHGEQNERAKAHAWLTVAQRVPEAWNFVWELLQPTKGTESQFYAATTLHTKILRCWIEVPPESHEELKNKILQAIFTYSKGPKIVTNRLCISLAAFILQQGTMDLAEVLRPLSNIENSSLLLEVLTMIPEEYNSMTMGSTLRSKNKEALQRACPAVLDDMLRILQSVYNDYSKDPPTEAMVQSWTSAALCASSWMSLNGEDSIDQVISLPDRMPLCRALLTAVHVLHTYNYAVSDSALDACEACLATVRTAGGGGGDPSRYPTAGLQLLSHLAVLSTPIMAKDDVPNTINDELLYALVTCCVALAETHITSLVRAVESNENTEEVNGVKQLLEILLRVQASPGHYMLNETRSNLVFGFWYSLQDEVLNIVDGTQEIQPVWREVFSRLLLSLVTKAEMPAESALCKDDMENLRCYRQDIADTVMYCFGILGDWCWTTVENAYNAATTESKREAALHVFLSLSDAAPQQRAPQPLLNMLQHAVNIANVSQEKWMLHTALDCLGAYASWLSSVGGGRWSSLGSECVRAAGGALPRCPASAALALRKLCADCAAPAADLAPDIVNAAQSSEGRSDAWVRRQLVAAAGAALAAAEPHNAAPLLNGLAETLREDLRLQALEPNRTNGAAECCAALLSALAPKPELAAQLFAAVLPVLPPMAQDNTLIEPLFSILKETLSTLMDASMEYVTEISQLTVAGFATHPCAVGMDVIKLIVLVLGNNWIGAREVFHTCVASSARALAQDLSSKSDLIEGLFILLQNITKKKPQYLDWIEDLLSELTDLARACILVWEGYAACAACRWLAALAANRPRSLHAHAPALTADVLRCIGGATPRNQIEPFADLLLGMNRAVWVQEGAGGPAGDLGLWLRQALALDGFPTHHATEQHKQKFIAAIVKEKSNRRRILESIREFSLVCRGLVGTEYARQTLASKQLVT